MGQFPTRKRIRLNQSVYHQGHAFSITIATHEKYPWFEIYSALCESAVELMSQLALAQEMALYAWCIMPDHLHMLIQGRDVVEFVRTFKGRMTPQARLMEPERRLWQRSFFDHALRKEEALVDVARYIWENPVRAKIVKDPRDYSWMGSEVWPNWREFCGSR